MNRFVPLRRHQRERGVTAIEFAILFPVFFSILYAIIQYGIYFAVQQTLTLAAEEGARAALQYQTASSPTLALIARKGVALSTCQGMVTWATQMTNPSSSSPICTATLPAQCPSSTSTSTSNMYCVQVVTSVSTGNFVVPTLPGLSFLFPSSLGSTAIVQIDPANVI
jgi:Flp pilus assembly protein TadG